MADLTNVVVSAGTSLVAGGDSTSYGAAGTDANGNAAADETGGGQRTICQKVCCCVQWTCAIASACFFIIGIVFSAGFGAGFIPASVTVSGAAAACLVFSGAFGTGFTIAYMKMGDFDTQVKRLTAENDRLHQTNVELAGTAERLGGEVDTLTETNGELKTTATGLRHEKEAIALERQQFSNENVRLTTSVQGLQQTKAGLDASILKQNKQIVAQRAMWDDGIEDLDKVEARMVQMSEVAAAQRAALNAEQARVTKGAEKRAAELNAEDARLNQADSAMLAKETALQAKEETLFEKEKASALAEAEADRKHAAKLQGYLEKAENLQKKEAAMDAQHAILQQEVLDKQTALLALQTASQKRVQQLLDELRVAKSPRRLSSNRQ